LPWAGLRIDLYGQG